MHEFEFLRFVTIGQYLPTGSIIHRLDPRTRLVSGLLLVIVLTLTSHGAGLCVALAALGILLAVARIPLGYALKGLVAPLPFLVFLAALQVLFGPRDAARLLVVWGPLSISTTSLLNGALLIARFVALILTLSLISYCLSTTELVHGLDALLAPFTKIGLPTHAFVLMVQVTLRFLPLLALEAERIAKSQASRGAEWGTGRGGVLRRARQAFPLLVPLFLTGLQRAENLALAMEARGYQGGKGRTSLTTLHFRPADAVALAVVVGLAVVVMRA
ncbi:MAG TPA: energy-coupling factor transporter transmembrane component T [Anaerolineae bacterium]|nr:energy-coupling factor transporter transmembrane component T [Anaerolineae bacterium]HQH39078.1 energy-coupling factor transporter transmembrane component T [Anaerolineae bacterium]